MARGYGRRRGNAISPKLIAIIAGAALLVLVLALFWFAGQADSHRPPIEEIRVPAKNIGPQPATAPGTPNAPSQ